MAEPTEILAICEVAAVLKVATKTIYTMAQTVELPGFKFGDQWWFRPGDIDECIKVRADRGECAETPRGAPLRLRKEGHEH